MRKIVSIGLSFIMLLSMFCALTACEDEGTDTANAISSQGSEKENTAPDNTQTSSSETNSNQSTTETRDVPRVVDMTREEAEKTLVDAGFNVKVAETFSNVYAKGKVISQLVVTTDNGSSAVTVEITVSKGKDVVKVPNLIGKTLLKAKEILKDSGLTVKSDIKCSDTVKEGQIISQDIKAGKSVARDTVVTVCVSAGKSNSVGNSNSNNLNGNIVIVQGNWIYFTNYGKDNGLYKMRKDGSDRSKLTNSRSGFNVLGEWIYFSDFTADGQGMYKMKLDGTDKTKLDNSPFAWLFVTKNWIYCSESRFESPIYRMKHDGSSKMQVCSENVSYANIVGERIYYIDENMTGIYRINTDGTDKVCISNYRNIRSLVCDNGMLYASDNCRTVVVLDKEGNTQGYHTAPCDSILLCSVYDGWLYYYEFKDGNNDAEYLCKARPDFSERSIVCDFTKSEKAVNYFTVYEDGWLYFAKQNMIHRLNVTTQETENLSK